MNPLTWAAAMAVVGGIAREAGWAHAVGAASLVVVVMIAARIVRDGPTVRLANGAALAQRQAHRIAEWIVAAFVAALRSPALSS
jgi:hypothetical protein